MRKLKRLTLSSETLRHLTGGELEEARGGQEKLSGPPDVCRPYSNGTPTCTTCGGGTGGFTLNNTCTPSCDNGTEG